MDSTQEGSSVYRSKGKEVDNTRRSWTPKEEEVLILGLKEIVAQGWKVDNAFRSGYLKELERFLKKHLPDTDIRGLPHINSKITTWKKSYYALCAVLSQSGVGFNADGTHMVDCDPTLKAQVLKDNPRAKAVLSKSWPLYNDWTICFGNDRATGDVAHEILDAVNDIEIEDPTNAQEINDGDYHVNLDDILSQDHAENSVCQSQQAPKGQQYKSKKRKSMDGFDKVCEVLREISSNANERLDKLASRMGYDYDLDKARSEVFKKLGNIQGLLSIEKFKVFEILGKEIEKLQIFNALPESAQAEYVDYILHCS